MKITLIGLGISEGDITLRAKRALDNATKILVRTAHSQSFESLAGYSAECLDEVFEKSRNFDTLNKNLAARVLSAAKEGDVCYCVDGAVCEDEACKIILNKHKDCEVLESVSKASHAYNTSRLTAAEVTCVSAYSVQNLKSCRAALIYDIDCDYIASLVKEKLTYIFGEESDCFFIRGDKSAKIKIYEIDRQKVYDGTCAVSVQEVEFLKKDRYDYADLEEIVRLLRAPGGCPWDRVQTSESIKGNMIEEAYELADAIERGDTLDMEEETGDVMLQAAFHSVMQAERGEFTGGDALTHVVKKLIYRHSHIFGGDKAASESEALGVWEKNKRKEKGQDTFSDSIVAVPKNMPACMRAQKVGKRSAKSGMDFPSAEAASKKLAAEAGELLEALKGGDKGAIAEEAGDLLFSAVNTCRLAGVDCEDALHSATDKFIKRFTEFERLANQNGESIEKMTAERQDYYWALAKDAVK